ncbi:MAG: hypothetical protein KC591_12325 [Gemmatimonadetes bacterium]|nr:hypothetical protein [Gemmatimonadota bacterium]
MDRRILQAVAFVAVAIAVVAIAGCGGMREHIRQHNTRPEVLDPVGTYLGPRVGVLTYDQALMDWGHPAHVTNGDTIFLATWTEQEAATVGGEFARLFTAENGGPALNATFDLDTRTLQSFGFSRK